MAYEKQTYFKELGKFNWEKACFCDIKLDSNNDQLYIDKQTGEKHFKIIFYFSEENGLYVYKPIPYCEQMFWGSKSTKEWIFDMFRTIGVDSEEIHDALIMADEKALLKQTFVSISGENKKEVSGSDEYFRQQFFVNPMRSEKSIKEVDLKALIGKFESLNKPSATPAAPASMPTQTPAPMPTPEATSPPPEEFIVENDDDEIPF